MADPNPNPNQVRLTVDSPRGGSKRGGADDEVIQHYEHSAEKGSP